MNPFAQLLGLVPARLPKTKSSRLIVAGKPVTDVRQISKVLGVKSASDEDVDDLGLAEVRRLKAEARRVKERAKYQRCKEDPARMAKRKEWHERNREKVRAWKKKYDERTRVRQRETKAAHARRARAANPEAANARSREYYQRNREKILAKKKAEREANRQSKAVAAQGVQP